MIVAGLPIESWLLVVASVGIGLAIEIAFFRAHRRAERRRGPGNLRSPRDAERDTHDPGRPAP